MGSRKRVSSIRYSTVEACVRGTERSVAIGKGQAVDLAEVIGVQPGKTGPVPMTIGDALGRLAETFTTTRADAEVDLGVIRGDVSGLMDEPGSASD